MKWNKRVGFKEFVLMLLLGLSLPARASLDLKILARVADTSISNRDMILDWLLQNPKSYVQGRRSYFSKDVEQHLLQKKVVQVLVEEENRIVGTLSVSKADVDAELLRVKRGFGPRWNTFLQDFEVSEVDIRKMISSYLLVDQTLQARIRDSLRGLHQQDEASMTRAEDSLQTWLQQLRSRYRVQIFRYP
jgi:hypothetical protein